MGRNGVRVRVGQQKIGRGLGAGLGFRVRRLGLGV